MEGPADKVVTFLGVREYRRTLRIPASPHGDDALDYLGGKTMDDLIQAEQCATALALARAGRPSMTLTLDRVSPRSVGMLLYVLEMQTAIAAELFGINAFDQPGVEEGKRLTYAMMGRPGYGALRREISRVEKRCVSRHTIELR
jgi:glucose-6-phosphate isomerase